MTAMLPSTALLGDVLGKGDTVRVLVARHPFRQSRETHDVPAGLSLAEIARLPGVGAEPEGWRAYLDGHAIPAKRWARVRPKSGATVVLRAVASGPIAAAIGAIVGAISAATAAISGFLGGLGILGKVIGLGLSLAANYVLNALFAARPPQLAKEPDKKPSYSLSGSRNSAAPWEAVPVVYGQHRVTPFLAAPVYTETVGDDQFLRAIFCFGYGPLAIGDIKIGETPIGSFSDVQMDIREGYASDPIVGLYPGQVIEDPLSVDLKSVNDWTRRTTATDITSLSYDIVFPQGVFYIVKDGIRRPLPINIQARYRLVGTQAWTPAPPILETIKTIDTVRRTVVVNVPLGQYEFEIKRFDPDVIAGLENDTVVKDAVWTALRGMRPGYPITFPKPLALVGIRIRATSQLNGSLDTVNAIATSILPGVRSGAPAQTANPADIYLSILQGPANARPVASDLIDIDRLRAWADYCDGRAFRYDYVRLERASVWDSLLDVCAAGRAVPIWRDGRWSVVWDELDAPVVQMFTPANSWGFETRVEYREPIHAWRARFVNREKGFVEDERIIYDDGYSAANATRFEGIEFPGVTVPQAVWRHGRFQIAQARLRPATYTISTDFEHLVCTRGDRVRVSHDVLEIGLAFGRIVAVDPASVRVTVSESIVLGAASYQIRVRRADGSFLLRDVASVVNGEGRTLQLVADGSALPAVGDLFVLGQRSIESSVYRILSIEAQADMSARLTLVDDAPEISQADQGAIPPFTSPVQAPVDMFQSPPRAVRWEETFVPAAGDQLLTGVILTWDTPARGEVARYQTEILAVGPQDARWQPGPVVPESETRVTISGMEPGLYRLRVRAIFVDGRFSAWSESEAADLSRLLKPPPSVADLRIDTLGPVSALRWDAVSDPSVGFYEVRFTRGTGPATWNTAVVLVDRAQPGVQVPSMVGTYLVKAGRINGARSAVAAMVRSSIAELTGLNVVETIDETGFPGVGQSVEIIDGTLRLSRRALLSTWESLDTVPTLLNGDGGDDTIGVEVSGTYELSRRIDLGVSATSRITVAIDAYGETIGQTMDRWVLLSDIAALDDTAPEAWRVELDVSTCDVDPASGLWSAWRPITVGDVTARAMRFRLRLEAPRVGLLGDAYALTTPVVTRLRVTIDMPDRVVGLNDIAVPAGGRRIAFIPPFRATPAIATADQGMQMGDTHIITNKGPTGFNIEYRNATGVPVARTVDIVAKGYGSA